MGSKGVLQVAKVEKGEVDKPIMDSEEVAEGSKVDKRVTMIVNLERFLDVIQVEDAPMIVHAEN
jgi:hypothetical protein